MPPSGPGPEWERRLGSLLDREGISPRRPDLFHQAFLHRSRLNETSQAGVQSNEKLEFLGDSILGMAVSEYLWHRHPGLTEGQLSRRRAALVSEKALSTWARELGLGELLLLGKGEARSGGSEKDALLADCLEAFLAALYLDQGLAATRSWVDRHLEALEGAAVPDSTGDAKSRLQEWTQAHLKEAPRYRLKGTVGPDHARSFEIEVLLQDKVRATGKGRSKKEAEQDAATKALKQLTA
jgi:ribonuclease-3